VLNHSQVPVLCIKPSFEHSEKVPSIKLAEKWGRSVN
jgi:hypothetical protein